jgi:hypothetical protein
MARLAGVAGKAGYPAAAGSPGPLDRWGGAGWEPDPDQAQQDTDRTEAGRTEKEPDPSERAARPAKEPPARGTFAASALQGRWGS